MASSDPDSNTRKNRSIRSTSMVQEAIAEINEVLADLVGHNEYLDIESSHHRILNVQMESKVVLSDLLKVLLTLNGSVTQALQAIQLSPSDVVKIKTLNQVIVGFESEQVDARIFQSMGLPSNSLFNFRKVLLHAGGKNFVLAISLVPLSMLAKDFQDDLLRSERPIGFLIEKYKLEVLRKISVIDTVPATRQFQEYYGIDDGSRIPYRVYDIFYKDNILMKIIEFFNPTI